MVKKSHWLSKYPWDKWLNGRRHTVVAGVDFTSNERSFTVYLYNKAKKMGKKFRIESIANGTLVIQAFEVPKERKQKSA